MQLPVIPSNVPTADNTVLSWHDRCPQLYEYAALRGLTSPGTSAALQFGSILHAGLEAWYRTHDARAALEAVRDYQDFEEIPGEYRTRGRALSTIAEHIEWWGENTDWWGDEVLFTESPFTLEDSDGFRYGGRIDLIVMYHGKPWIVDHKSTSRGGNSYWTQFELNPQLAGYVWAGSLLHGEPIAGVIVNRMVVHANKKPASEMFERRAFLYSQQKIDDWRRSKIAQYHEMQKHLESGYYPRRTRNCVEKFGTCQFHDICTTDKLEDREMLIERNYIVKPWDWMEVE